MLRLTSSHTLLLLVMTVSITSTSRNLSNRTRRTPVNVAEARQALCPMVGYQNAHYCPGVNQTTIKKRNTPLPPLLLPRGVGMTIDISTGAITLPALELTYSDRAEKLWTDPSSKQSFIIPNEVLLTSVSDNVPVIRIFKTEVDLVNVWTRNADGGYWTGGEFGLAKNVRDVYTTFFTDNQATSVAQHPFGLYVLTMTSADSPSSLKLNKYAKATLEDLTQVYDEEVYNSFMNVWGTHIAVSTKIGGMKEQQAVFKNCIWSSPYFTGGLSMDEMKNRLQEDLLSPAPCDSYYLSRRKLAIDHLVGGNVAIQDIDAWKKTIALDPALLEVIKYIPWYDVVTDVTVKTNLRKAMTIRINTSNIARMSSVEKITAERTSLRQRSAQYGVRFTLGDVHQCPDGLSTADLQKNCNTGKNVTACSVAYANFEWTTTWDVPLCYERNRTTGSFRAVARRLAGKILSESAGTFRNYDLNGPWIEGGCSWLEIPCKGDGRGITDAFICAGCTPITDREKKAFTCPCPAYEMDPAYQPYC